MKFYPNLRIPYIAGLAGMAGLLAASAQTTPLPADFAHAANSVDTTAPGFRVRVFQGSTVNGTVLTRVATAESLLAGALVMSGSNQVYTNIADVIVFTDNGYYDETTALDYEQGGGSGSGLSFPGVPGLVEPDNRDNIALEAITYLVLQPGTYSMIVNSDDGFRVTAGSDPRDKFNALVLGEYDATRGSGDTVFNFSVSTAGAYGFRLLYFENGGGANVSWYLADPNDSSIRTLINTTPETTSYRRLNGASEPFVDLASPGPGQTGVAPNATLTYRIVDGAPHVVVPGTVQLFLDNNPLAATISKTNSQTLVTFTPATLLASLSTHSVKLVYADNATPANYHTNQLQFVVTEYANLVLPAPLYMEDFESFPEQVDAPQAYLDGTNTWTYHGWTSVNYTSPRTPGWDLNDPNSDAFLGWVILSTQRVLDIGTAGHWEGSRRVSNVAIQYVNGHQVTTLMSNNFFYAESDQRGGSQVQYLFSPDWDLTTKSNIYVYYHSMYEQNQDSIGSVEYSIDQGKTWLPIVYMIDRDDIKKDGTGAIDGYATLSATQSDTAHYTDPITGEEIGYTYGSFVGVASNLWSTLGTFISGRINDDPVESKRVEFYRIPMADGQAKVRFRFAQAGTGSWYFGIDNFALYSIAPVVAKPAQPVVSAPGTVDFFAKTVTVFGSAFQGFKPADTHALSTWQLAAGPAFSADTGLAVPFLTVKNATNLTTVTLPTERLFPGATYYVSVQYQDQTGAKSDFAQPAAFTVGTLPTPIVLETFETTPDYSVPTGWTLTNQTDVINPGLNPADLNSDTYLDWTVVPFSTLVAIGGGRADFTNVVNGKSLYAESDNRSGNQIQIVVTPDFNLTGKSGIWLAFRSSYVQNQDNIGVAEYSIDQGTTWLPVVYLLDDQNGTADIKRNADGSIDAVKTFTTTYSDVAKVLDSNGQRVAAGKYGDFVLARPYDSLAPYISGRINDDKTESRRYERFRLPAADNQAKVRVRFVQAGTGSWWWGLDDVGLYSMPTSGSVLSIARSGTSVVLSWSGAGTLQEAASLTGSWTTSASQANPQTINPTSSKFYRMKQ